LDLTIEQPPPVPGDVTCVQDLVIADMQTRKQIGIARYGTALQPNNGRDALRDAYEEALDLCCYLRQAIIERDQIEAGPG
jgi:hypothetical protein